jgi:diguanylate cyclase (GGDEF)-like protein
MIARGPGVITGIEVPLELAALLCAGSMAFGAWGGRLRSWLRPNSGRPRAHDPLAGIHKPEVFAQTIDLAARRNAARAGSQAMLYGRIDQFASLSHVWNSETRQEVREHVAAVMRAGLRRNDRITIRGDNFTILVPGADERAAVRVADRLRHKLAQLVLPQLDVGARLSATFGVAARHAGDPDCELDLRARHALDAAMARGIDHVVPASEIEEIMLLPAPAPSPCASAA